MTQVPSDPLDTTTLSTKLEENFVSPLTAVRGSLEILRDFPDLEARERRRFVESALQECARLERGVQELAAAVYAAARAQVAGPEQSASVAAGANTDRLRIDEAAGVVEIDFSDFEFSKSSIVNAFFDVIECLVRPTGRRWYFMTNFRDCRVWPEAWVAFAHRGRKVAVNLALGTVRYAEGGPGDPGIFPSREAALAEIGRMKASKMR